MKSYFTIICKYLQYCIPAFVALLLPGCHPGYVTPRNVDVFTKKIDVSNYKNKSLMILPFDSAEMKPDLGIETARMFESAIYKKKVLRQVIFREDAAWEKQMIERDQKVRAALAAAKEQNADLLLWGAIEDFLPGTATETVVTLNVMLISVSQGTMLWWGRDKAVGRPGNTFLYAGQRISPDPPPVDRLLSDSAHRIVDDMFPQTGAARPVRYLRAMMRKIYSPAPATPPERQDTQPAASISLETKEPPVSPERDVLDRAIDELDAAD